MVAAVLTAAVAIEAASKNARIVKGTGLAITERGKEIFRGGYGREAVRMRVAI